MKYEPHEPDYWEWVDMKQVETMERKLSQLDPDYLDDLRDPTRAARGIFYMIIISIIFWGNLCLLVWAANTLIGGG